MAKFAIILILLASLAGCVRLPDGTVVEPKVYVTLNETTPFVVVSTTPVTTATPTTTGTPGTTTPTVTSTSVITGTVTVTSTATAKPAVATSSTVTPTPAAAVASGVLSKKWLGHNTWGGLQISLPTPGENQIVILVGDDKIANDGLCYVRSFTNGQVPTAGKGSFDAWLDSGDPGLYQAELDGLMAAGGKDSKTGECPILGLK